MSRSNKLVFFNWPEYDLSGAVSDRESDDYLLNTYDLYEVEELLNVFFYKKVESLDFGDMLNLEKFPDTKKRLRHEVWDYLKGIYFKE